MNVFRDRIGPVEFDYPQTLLENLHFDDSWRKPPRDIEYLGYIRDYASLCDDRIRREFSHSEMEFICRDVLLKAKGLENSLISKIVWVSLVSLSSSGIFLSTDGSLEFHFFECEPTARINICQWSLQDHHKVWNVSTCQTVVNVEVFLCSISC